MVLVLTRKDIESLISMGDAINLMEEVLFEIFNGTAFSTFRPFLEIPEKNGGVLLNVGYLKKMGGLGVKIASSFPNNRERNLPTVSSIIVLNNPETGIPEVIMEAGYLTALKTGAVGGVAVKYLSRHDSDTVAIIGAGQQSKAQLLAITHVRNIKKVNVFSRTLASSRLFVEEMQKLLNYVEFVIASSSKEAIKEADIIVTATTSKNPVINGEDLCWGAHINGIGSFTPDAAEIDTISFSKAKRVFVDNEEAIKVGDILQAIKANVLSEQDVYHLSQVVVGKIIGRRNSEEITIFKSVGGAPYDVALALQTYILALKNGKGIEINLNF